MNTRATVRKLLAFNAGKPLAYGTKLRLPQRAPRDTLVMAFVRMGGESRPWGIAVGRPKRLPEVFAVPEPRNRELVGAMLAEFAPRLLEHMGHPEYAKGGEGAVPYVWLPNASHVEMLHFLALTYTFAKRGPRARVKVLNALGRAANWLFQESTRPGQLSCIDASRALRDAYTFPAEGVRQAHTGYLLAWLETRGGFNARLRAASRAEMQTVSTSLDPQIERSGLDADVEAFNQAKRSKAEAEMRKCDLRIRKALSLELLRRFEIAVRAYSALAADDRAVNPGLSKLEERASEQHQEYLDVEDRLLRGQVTWVRSPATDVHSLVAASGYVTLEADRDRCLSALVHHDDDLQEDVLMAGDGLRGTVVGVGTSRQNRARWVVDEDDNRPLRVRLGDVVVQAGHPHRKAALRDVRELRGSRRRFEMEIVAGAHTVKGSHDYPALSDSWRGKVVTFLNLGEPGFAFVKRRMLWNRVGPGTWLTHRQPWEQDWLSAAGEDDLDVDAGPA